MKRESWAKRQKIVAAVRTFFTERDFLEVETPALSVHRDVTPHILDFQTDYIHDGGKKTNLGMITSPEHYMKRLLADGWGNIFQICKFFRNGEVSRQHNPEFTGLEWYQTGATYNDCMNLTEELVRYAGQALNVKSAIYNGIRCDISNRFERLTVRDAFLRYTGMDLNELQSKEVMIQACLKMGQKPMADEPWDDMFFRIFLSAVEPKLGIERPVFLHDYPPSMAALSIISEHDGRWSAERFELYICGVELCNGFSELRDPVEQRARFKRQIEEKNKIHGGEYTIDEEFIEALGRMPQAAGNAMGLDRLTMILLDLKDISEAIPFPLFSSM